MCIAELPLCASMLSDPREEPILLDPMAFHVDLRLVIAHRHDRETGGERIHANRIAPAQGDVRETAGQIGDRPRRRATGWENEAAFCRHKERRIIPKILLPAARPPSGHALPDVAPKRL